MVQLDDPVTVFAPTNEAFKAIPAATISKLMANPSDLKKLIMRHFVKGAINPNDLGTTIKELKGLDGSSIKVTTGPGGIIFI